MEILEIAKELGLKIKENPVCVKYNEANEAYEKDEALQGLVAEYNTQRMAMEEELQKDTPDDDFINAIEDRIEEIYNEVIKNPIYITFAETQEEFDKLMHVVNDEITFQITGQRSCNHDDCSECAGGCHSH